MHTKFVMRKMSLAVSSALILSGCGGSDESNSGTNAASTYAYQNALVCVDADLSGSCSEYESQLSSVSGYSKMLSYDGAILTASEQMEVVTPFTTLIHSEMLFNPSVGNDIEQAKASLQVKLGKKAGIDFSTLDTSHGPIDASNTVLKSLKKAQSQGKYSTYVNISHALDLMIANETLDLTNIDVAGTPSRHMDLDGSVIIHGSQSISGLSGAKSSEFNPANGKLVFVTSSDEVKQVDTRARNQSLSVQSQSLSLRATPYDDDDDDDDDHDYQGGSLDDLLGYQKNQSNQIIQLVPALNSIQAYKVYQPTSSISKQASDICNTQGSNGIFLTSIAEPVKSQARTQSVSIDSYSGGSGATLPPLPKPDPVKPTVPTSSSACFNDNFEAIYPLYRQKTLLAVKASSAYSNKELKLLNSADLSMKGMSHELKATSTLVVPSYDESEVLLIDSSTYSSANILPEVVNSTNLSSKVTLDKQNVVSGTFATENQLLLGLNTNVIQWVTKSAYPTTISDLTLDATIKHMSTSPDGKVSAIATTSSLYIVDNVKRKLIKQHLLSGSTVNKLFVLEDKVLTLTSSGMEYYQFKNIEGPALKLSGQIVTKELLKQWESQGNSSWSSTSLGYVLQQVGTDAAVADRFDGVTLRFRPSNATSASTVQGVEISALDRGQWVSLYKSL
ncbi:hypothetical protein L4C33_06290 [Vibrio makurazakiensis]|uniref:hypothetical protein n=1 Tax=Vibrio makurazakiensis TaxID=2910250 RepID=UPI003D140A40